MIAYTTSAYSLGKMMGQQQAVEVIGQMMAGKFPQLVGAAPTDAVPENVRTAHTLGLVCDHLVKAYTDAGGAHLGRMRSRAMHWAAEQEDCDFWVSCDDDVTADTAALREFVRVLSGDEPVVACVPYKLRPGAGALVDVVGATQARKIDGDPGRGMSKNRVSFDHAGCGLFGMNRSAIKLTYEANKRLRYRDVDGVVRCGMFLDEFHIAQEGTPADWYPDDYAFFRRLPSAVARVAVICGRSVHAGQELDLWQWGDALP